MHERLLFRLANETFRSVKSWGFGEGCLHINSCVEGIGILP